MSTTAVIIEHLICGIQVLLWIFFLILSLFGYEWVIEGKFNYLSTELMFVALAIVYPVGIFFDEFADLVFDNFSKKIRQSRFEKEKLTGKDKNKDITAMCLLQYSDNEFLMLYFNYIRMRIRISRSATLNFGITTLFVVIFTISRLSVDWKVVVMEFIIGSLLTLLACFAWYRFSDTFAKRVAMGWKQIKNKK